MDEKSGLQQHTSDFGYRYAPTLHGVEENGKSTNFHRYNRYNFPRLLPETGLMARPYSGDVAKSSILPKFTE